MPLYEYECEACGHRFEKIQKFSDALIDECPKCGEKKVHKLVSSPAIQFKGSGWYITDYAKKGMTAADGSKTGEAKSADDKPADKSADKSAKPDQSSSASSATTSGSSDSAPSSTTPSSKT
jgi:putative FmdB family regulatory protein